MWLNSLCSQVVPERVSTKSKEFRRFRFDDYFYLLTEGRTAAAQRTAAFLILKIKKNSLAPPAPPTPPTTTNEPTKTIHDNPPLLASYSY